MCYTLNMRRLLEESLVTLKRLPGLKVTCREEVVGPRHGHYDALVTVRAHADTDDYAAEVKPRVTTRSLSSLLSQLAQVRQASGALPMLLTDHVTPAVADMLEAHDIAYADSAGNVFLNGPAAYVLVRGHRPEKATPRTGLTKTDLELVFAILSRPQLLEEPLRQIAVATGVSLGKVSNTLRTLDELRLIRHQGRRKVLHDPRRLLDRWEVGYLEVVRPRLGPSTWHLRAKTDLDETRRRAAHLPDTLVGGEFAADDITGFLKPNTLTLHVPAGETKSIAVELKLRPTTSEPDVVLLERFLPPMDQADQPSADTTRAAFAHPILVRAELLALGGDRLREVADRLRDDAILPGLRDVA